MADLRRILWHLLGGTRGGIVRIQLLQALADRPWNTNQLAERLGRDYKTIAHHIKVLGENRIIEGRGDKYGRVYFWSPDMEASAAAFADITRRVAPDLLPASPVEAHLASGGPDDEAPPKHPPE